MSGLGRNGASQHQKEDEEKREENAYSHGVCDQSLSVTQWFIRLNLIAGVFENLLFILQWPFHFLVGLSFYLTKILSKSYAIISTTIKLKCKY